MAKTEQLIAKLYKGTCSKRELEELLDLISEAPNAKYDKVMAKLWKALKTYPEIEPSLAGEMMQELLNRIEEQEPVQQENVLSKPKEPKIHIRSSRRYILQIASAAAILLLVGMFFWHRLGAEKLVTVQTAYAEQKTFELPDQSIVKLNANSSLRYQQDWTSNQIRQVWLQGEAYFEVRKNEETEQKFQVITKDLIVEVLGTVFNVNTREITTEVFLEEGKVNLDLEEQAEDILMQPGELVTYSKSAGALSKKQVQNEAPSSWKNGTAILEDASLKNIIRKLHELYEVSIVVENEEELEREFSIFLPVDDPETGYLMLQGLGLQVQKANNVWTIHK